MKKTIVILSIIAIIAVIVLGVLYTDSETRFWVTKFIGLKNPTLTSNQFIVKEIAVGLPSPYQMIKIENDIIFLSKNSKELYLIQNEQFIDVPIDVPLPNENIQDLKGIETHDSNVYLYYSEAKSFWETLENRIYKLEWKDSKLTNPQLIEPNHVYTDTPHAGEMIVLPDGELYVAVGKEDAGANIENLSHTFANYFAFGIHGFAFDTISGYLWHTEEGIDGLEINVIFPNQYTNQENLQISEEIMFSEGRPLVNPQQPPVFRWNYGGYPEGITFLSDKWGEDYSDVVMVAGCDTGELFAFKLNSERNGFVFGDQKLSDNTFDENDSLKSILFGENFWCATDMMYEPEGILYVVSNQFNGVIYKIMPKN